MAVPLFPPVFRFHAYSPGSTLVYNYALNPDAGITQGWTPDGIGFFSLPADAPEAVPVYSYYAEGPPWKMKYSLTDTSPGTGWSRFGIAFYAYPQLQPVYEFETNDLRHYYSIRIDPPDSDYKLKGVCFNTWPPLS